VLVRAPRRPICLALQTERAGNIIPAV